MRFTFMLSFQERLSNTTLTKQDPSTVQDVAGSKTTVSITTGATDHVGNNKYRANSAGRSKYVFITMGYKIF